jgi:hypothetical protein
MQETKFDEVFEKYFPKISMKNDIFHSIVLIIKTMLTSFNKHIDNNITRDI